MNTKQATELAVNAIQTVTALEPVPVADMTVLHLNDDGSYTVVDNGENVVCESANEATRIIVENLTEDTEERELKENKNLTDLRAPIDVEIELLHRGYNARVYRYDYGMSIKEARDAAMVPEVWADPSEGEPVKIRKAGFYQSGSWDGNQWYPCTGYDHCVIMPDGSYRKAIRKTRGARLIF